jgi:hypothetical protein
VNFLHPEFAELLRAVVNPPATSGPPYTHTFTPHDPYPRGDPMDDYEHFAEYLHPGSFFPEECSKKLPERTIAAAVAEAPEDAYCFTFYDRVATAPDLGSELMVVRRPLNRSSRHYLGGQVFTLPELRTWIDEHGGDERHFALYANIRGYGTRAILCRTGNWQPFTDDDVLIEETT